MLKAGRSVRQSSEHGLLEAVTDMPLSVQTVPSCQTLYKNSFEYHTVAAAPPDFDECCGFMGQPSGSPPQVSPHVSGQHSNASTVPAALHFTCGDVCCTCRESTSSGGHARPGPLHDGH